MTAAIQMTVTDYKPHKPNFSNQPIKLKHAHQNNYVMHRAIGRIRDLINSLFATILTNATLTIGMQSSWYRS